MAAFYPFYLQTLLRGDWSILAEDVRTLVVDQDFVYYAPFTMYQDLIDSAAPIISDPTTGLHTGKDLDLEPYGVNYIADDLTDIEYIVDGRQIGGLITIQDTGDPATSTLLCYHSATSDEVLFVDNDTLVTDVSVTGSISWWAGIVFRMLLP